jgi:hypothetical protein
MRWTARVLCVALVFSVFGTDGFAALPKQKAPKPATARTAAPAAASAVKQAAAAAVVPATNVAVPAVRTIAPAAQTLPSMIRLLTTPRAHITLHPPVNDPGRIVALSEIGRASCRERV